MNLHDDITVKEVQDIAFRQLAAIKMAHEQACPQRRDELVERFNQAAVGFKIGEVLAALYVFQPHAVDVAIQRASEQVIQ